MQKKVMAIAFLMSIILSFVSGYLIQDVLNISFFNRNDDLLNQISEIFESNYIYDVNDSDLEAIYTQNLFNFVDTFATYYNDPYTRLEAYNTSNLGDPYGMGIRIIFDSNIPVIQSVSYDSDAYQKLYPGDHIMAVRFNSNWIEFNSLDTKDDVLNYLKGTFNEEKEFRIKNVLGDVRDITIRYTDLTPIDVAYGHIQDLYGYINIARFNPSNDNDFGTAYRFKEALESLENSILSAQHPLIIDLRNNPGGSLSALHNKNSQGTLGIIQQLLPYNASQSIFEFVDNEGKVTKYYGSQDSLKPYPIIVLVNQHSASASEVLAASLSSFGYPIYGEQTFGKHVYQNSRFITQINDMDYVLFYTEGYWTYNNGVSISDTPISVTNMDLINISQSFDISFDSIVSIDQVSQSLRDVQSLMNLLFNTNLRSDGYMDIATSEALAVFQSLFDLPNSGRYDYKTYQALHDLWLEYSYNIYKDLDIASLIELYENR